jgi:undecaprenyl-phosphate galactose phosphotransferase
MFFDNMYARHIPFWQQIKRFFKVAVYSGLFILALLYCFEPLQHIHGIFTLIVTNFIFFYLLLGRYFIKKVLVAANLWQTPIILIGAGKTAEILMNSFQQDNGMNYNVVGIIQDNTEEVGKAFQGIPIIGSLATAEETVKRAGIKNVLLAISSPNQEYLAKLIYRLQPCVRNIIFVPDILGIPINSMKMETLLDEKLVLLRIKNNLARISNRLLKFSFDLILTICGGMIILPFLLLIAISIYFDSPGNVIFAHKRIGHTGKIFNCYKFRTMVMNAQEILKDYLEKNPTAKEEWEKDFKLKNDPRITKIGKFLRRTSLDEFPQLINVLKGDMSLVGPRPIVKDEIERYGEIIKDYYMVRPGITGFWQVNGRNDVDYESRVQMDCWYVRNWSLWLDVMILFKTIKVVINKKGSY